MVLSRQSAQNWDCLGTHPGRWEDKLYLHRLSILREQWAPWSHPLASLLPASSTGQGTGVVGWPPSPPKAAQEAARRLLCDLSDKKGPGGNSEYL